MKKVILSVSIVLIIIAIGVSAFFVIKNNSEKAETETTEKNNIIQFVIPEKSVYVSENETVNFSIGALENTDIVLKLGYTEIKPEEPQKSENGNYIYKLKCVMPSTKAEIESIGFVKIVYTCNGETFSMNGPQVVYDSNSKDTTVNDKATTTEAVSKIDNASNETTSLTEFTSSGNKSENYSETTVTQSHIDDQTFTEKKMCIITENRADVWPGDSTSATFNPTLSALTKGTMAYVSGTSSVYDEDKKETRYFYNLTYGRRILQSSAQFVSQSYGDNSITSSVNVTTDATELVFSETWHVPYNITLEPQSFSSSNGKSYSVNSFAPTKIVLTFYYTASCTGSMNVSNSSIISSATWSKDSSKNTATLTMNLKNTGKYYGCYAYYDNSGKLVIALNNKINSLAGSVILVDSGHGGSDAGALSNDGQVREADINLAQSIQLKNELEKRGATVYLTKTDDRKMTLDERIAYIYSCHPDFFISVHSNAAHTTSAYGTSIYYYKPMSQPFANAIYSRMVSCYNNYVYPSDSVKQSNISRGCNYKAFALTRVEECPSVLIELGFVTNDEECAKLCDSAIREKFAIAIADGITDYINRS